MLVKCRACGAKIERATAYKVQCGKRNEYYCNEVEFRDKQQAKKNLSESQDKLYRLVDEVFGRHITMYVLYKEMNEIATQYGYPLITQYITTNKDYLSGVMTKDFSSEYGQIRYFMAIIRNNMQSFKAKQGTEPIPVADFKFSPSNYKQRTQRKGFAEIE